MGKILDEIKDALREHKGAGPNDGPTELEMHTGEYTEYLIRVANMAEKVAANDVCDTYDGSWPEVEVLRDLLEIKT